MPHFFQTTPLCCVMLSPPMILALRSSREERRLFHRPVCTASETALRWVGCSRFWFVSTWLFQER
jgi:hypothetical protein